MLNIVFMGTPEFAIPQLEILTKHHNVLAVVTVPDKPAGRGRKLRQSAIKEYADNSGIPVFQPEKLKDPEFISAMQNLNPDLMIVVAFRMLPKEIWQIPKIGTFNLHASLLPQYRGAAPINWVIINGETESGNTTFFIDDKIDTGKILLQEKTKILPDETAGNLHDKLMISGASLILETVNKLESGDINPHKQSEITKIMPAPKIFKNDCLINWNETGENIYNLIRGLSPYPSAWTKVEIKGKTSSIKILGAKFSSQAHEISQGTIRSTNNKTLEIAVRGGFITVTELQLESKKKMTTNEFLNGYNTNDLTIEI
jgi:methionyl-tRNA formyltransferase